MGEPDLLDGLKWRTSNGWIQARASNTEPIVRVFAEAPVRSEAERLANVVLNHLD
ncbi:MAG: hypothetical protein IPG71_05360 [bacterium]|nr:hypothetical protein [bacterium]